MSAVKQKINPSIEKAISSGEFLKAASLLEESLPEVSGGEKVANLVALGEMYRRLRKYKKADTALQQALEMSPDNIFALLEVAELASQQKNYELALKSWDEVIDHPNSIRPTYVKRRRDKIAGELLSTDLKNEYENIVKQRIENHQGYHSVWLGDVKSKSVSRDGEERWAIIEEVIKKYDVKSVLDLGCAEGFYVRRAATAGCFSIGVDNNNEIFALSQAAKNLEKEQNSGFVLGKIGEELLDNLPEFDMVICLSVLHHVIRIEGLDSMKGYLKRIARKHKKAFLFDMGTSNEPGQKSELPDMGENPEFWIKDLLEECGFKNVTLLAETPSPNGVPRPFFLCRPE